jgi:hypothetical protein
LVRVCAIVVPDPALAPLIPPVIVPTVHANVLGVLAVSEIFVAVPLQSEAVFAVVTAGTGFTVSVAAFEFTEPFTLENTARYW